MDCRSNGSALSLGRYSGSNRESISSGRLAANYEKKVTSSCSVYTTKLRWSILVAVVDVCSALVPMYIKYDARSVAAAYSASPQRLLARPEAAD